MGFSYGKAATDFKVFYSRQIWFQIPMSADDNTDIMIIWYTLFLKTVDFVLSDRVDDFVFYCRL